MIVLQFEFLLLVPELPISKQSSSEAPVCFHGPESNRLIPRKLLSDSGICFFFEVWVAMFLVFFLPYLCFLGCL